MPQHTSAMALRTAPLAALLLSLTATSVSAQVGRAYCNVTEVEATQLTNAVRIDIRCDGRLDVAVPILDYVTIDPKEEAVSEVKPVKRVTFYFTNAKSNVGALIDIGTYPISHVELLPIPDTEDGVGLICTVALYTEAATSGINFYPDRIQPEWLQFSGIGPKPGEVRWLVEESEDRRGMVMMITSDRFAVEPEDDHLEPADVPMALELITEGDRIGLDALRAPLSDVVQAIAQGSGLKCAVAGDSRDRISMYAPPMDPELLLSRIAESQGMSISRQNGTTILSMGSVTGLPTYEGSETRSFPISYLQADEALRMLPVFLLRHVRVNEGANALVAAGSPYLLDRIARDIDVIDKPPCMIEVKVEVMTYFGEESLLESLELDGQVAALSAEGTPTDLGISFAPLGRMTPAFEARLRGLKRTGDLRTETRQRLRILNGSEGSIFVGDQPTIVTSYWDYLENTVRPELTIVDVGARLEIEPWTGDGEQITVRVAPTVSGLRGTDPFSGMPIISERSSEGSLRIRDGESVLLGGMTLESASRAKTKLDLPFLHALFGRRMTTDDTAEFAFIVTPRVIDAPRNT